MSCELAHLDGSYVLGALSPAERLEFERHMAGCAECSRSVRELAGIPGLLAQVDLSDIGDASVPPVPATLLPSLVSEVRTAQRRRSVWVGAAAASVAAVAVGTLAVATGLGRGPEPLGASSPTPTATSTASKLSMEAVGSSPVRADLALAGVAWGTRLEMTCSYGEGEDDYEAIHGWVYGLFVQTRDGRFEQVATWKGLPGRTMNLQAATAAQRQDIQRVEVRTSGGVVILRLSV
ncbi:zf-HC2 domain-containing protein [Knoellia sp. S7-12]|uniref:anti-sigma factor family protein n=1 Tax=Knoellia sp. S7-12 TaxID=3126698 RepID=UPI003368B8DB